VSTEVGEVHFWRIGWVAFVVLLLCVIGMNLVSRGALLLVVGSADLGTWGSDDFPKRLGVVAVAFLLIGLPYVGWVFELGARKVALFVQRSASDVAKP
jgi:hypothetical protein